MNPATRTRLIADVVVGLDPDGTSIEVKVDDTWHEADWLGDANVKTTSVNGVSVTRWQRSARTTGYFCGPDATPDGATVLGLGRHPTKTRVTAAGDQLVAESTAIEVKA